MAFSKTWDETKPAGNRDRSLGDDDIREFKFAIRERFAIDHFAHDDETGQDDTGFHKQVTFDKVHTVDPTNVANRGFLYLKDVNSVVELFWEDESGNVVQLTSAGNLNLGPGRMPNADYITARNNADSADLNIMRVTTGDVVEFLVGAILSASTDPAVDAGIACKKYVDERTNFKFGNFTRAYDAASGDVSYTGVGFQPDLIFFMSITEANADRSWGFSDGTTHKSISTADNGGNFYEHDFCIFLQRLFNASSLNDGQDAIVKSMDSDGFTLTWVKAGTPTALTCKMTYLAIKFGA